MELKPNVDIVSFTHQFNEFKDEYKEEVLGNLDNIRTAEDCVEIIGKPLMSEYDLLSMCYQAHGLYHIYSFDEQPQSARLGRRVAGLLWNMAREMVEDQSSKPASGNAVARFKQVCEPYKPEPKREPGPTVTMSDILAEHLSSVTPGMAIDFYYDDYDSAKSDQVLLRYAIKRAGWYDGIRVGLRPYRSRIMNDGVGFKLVVKHLSKAVEEKNYGGSV